MTHRLLVTEDSNDIAHLLNLHLTDYGYQVELATDGVQGLQKAMFGNYDLILLDIMLPKKDGLEVCKELRANSVLTPILMLTARSSELDRILGLEIGADDYLIKPFSIHEVLARVKAILRRAAFNARPSNFDKNYYLRHLSLDTEKRQVTIEGRKVILTAREFDLLLHFVRHPGRVFSRNQLLDEVWGFAYEGYEHTVNSHINRLRAKIEFDPAQPKYIRTVWGVGYQLIED